MLTIELDPVLRAEPGSDGRYSFAGHNKVILFGRHIDVDIRFPSDETRLGRRHFELRPSAGSYEIVTDREHPVFVDGMRVEGSMAILENTEIRLIDPKTGPWIRVAYQKIGGLETVPVPQPPLRPLHERMRNLRRAVGAVAVAVMAVGVFFGIRSYQQDQVLAAFANETKTLIAKLDEKPPIAPNWAQIYDNVKGSVYQVAIKKNDGSAPVPQATAWVYGPHTLVTNSHAAKLYFSLGPSESLMVIAPDNQQTMIKVIAPPKLHPAYERFRKVIEDVAKDGTSIGQVGSYDVAFLEVDTSVSLAPPLDIDRELVIGQQIGFLGFPSAFAKNDAAGQFRSGYVSGSTDFLGIAQNSKGELIYHTAEGSGGASGSPIFNDQGKVVAIFSGGESRKVGGTNIISGAGTFYAQSAALIDDLRVDWSEDKMKAAVAGWTNAALYLAKKNTVWQMLQEFGNPERLDRKDFPPAFEAQGAVGKDGSATLAANDLEPGTYLAFAQSKGELRLRVMIDGTAIQSPLYVNAMPTAIFKAEKGRASFVLMGAPDTSYWLQLHRFDEEDEEETTANVQ
jgi:hypothetical protein